MKDKNKIRKTWQDHPKNWSRKVVWYDTKPIKLKFISELGVQEKTYKNEADAETDYRKFVQGRVLAS